MLEFNLTLRRWLRPASSLLAAKRDASPGFRFVSVIGQRMRCVASLMQESVLRFGDHVHDLDSRGDGLRCQSARSAETPCPHPTQNFWRMPIRNATWFGELDAASTGARSATAPPLACMPVALK